MMKDTVINISQPLPVPADPRRASDSRPSGGSPQPVVPLETGKPLPQTERAAPSTEPPKSVEANLSSVVESLNDYLQSVERDLLFSVDDNSGRTIITVRDRESQEVIRQIPPEAVVALAEYLRDEGGLESMGVVEQA